MELVIQDISYRYGERKPWILEHFHMEINEQERVGIVAPSGKGKTTLCKLMAGYMKPEQGKVLLQGKPLDDYFGYCPVQMIWQHPELAVNPRFRMRDVLAEGDNVEDRVIRELGIRNEWMERFPVELSGGELQRFCIARALGAGTRFLLADEISTMLDLVTQRQIWEFLLGELKERQIGLVVVSHNQRLLDRVCTRQIVL